MREWAGSGHSIERRGHQTRDDELAPLCNGSVVGGAGVLFEESAAGRSPSLLTFLAPALLLEVAKASAVAGVKLSDNVRADEAVAKDDGAAETLRDSCKGLVGVSSICNLR